MRFDLKRDRDTVFYTSNIKERYHYGGPGVLVWGGIMLNRRTELHIFDRGSVTGDCYYDEVLLLHVNLFQGAIGPDFIFMADNARPYRFLVAEDLMESEDINRMDWPAYFLDLNPIEHVWDALRRRIAERLHHPENTRQLKQMLIEEWALLSQEILHQLVLSMPRRCEATIALAIFNKLLLPLSPLWLSDAGYFIGGLNVRSDPNPRRGESYKRWYKPVIPKVVYIDHHGYMTACKGSTPAEKEGQCAKLNRKFSECQGTLQLRTDFCRFHLLRTQLREVVDERWRDEDGTRAAPVHTEERKSQPAAIRLAEAVRMQRSGRGDGLGRSENKRPETRRSWN
ncbi:transposable element Tcb2 transposase [Trichonephila clavipes]|nr:transposable element Tcb2 transposase [Trichonephila clavipes]